MLVCATTPSNCPLLQAQAQLQQAAADYKRYQFLFKEGAVSPQEFDAMTARYKTAQAQVAEAATMTGYTVVKAPAAGVVAERKVAVGDLAQPGQALAVLYNPDLLQVEGEVNDNYRDQVKLGAMARVSVPAVQEEIVGDELVVRARLRVVENAAQLLEVRRAQQVIDVREGGLGERAQRLVRDHHRYRHSRQRRRHRHR